ncbi:hypothetical protein B296_00021164, partial [Ensete ventricosum]
MLPARRRARGASPPPEDDASFLCRCPKGMELLLPPHSPATTVPSLLSIGSRAGRPPFPFQNRHRRRPLPPRSVQLPLLLRCLRRPLRPPLPLSPRPTLPRLALLVRRAFQVGDPSLIILPRAPLSSFLLCSTLKRISRVGEGLDNLELRIDTKKSSARAAYDFFSEKLFQMKSSQLLIGPMKQGEIANLLNQEDEERVATVLRYVEDVDLRQWRMPDIEAFNIGLRDERAKVNCITNPFIFEQVCFLMPTLYTQRSCWERLLKSNWEEDYMASAWPIGAVVFMQRRNLKMCLRSTDCRTDTSEIAK